MVLKWSEHKGESALVSHLEHKNKITQTVKAGFSRDLLAALVFRGLFGQTQKFHRKYYDQSL